MSHRTKEFVEGVRSLPKDIRRLIGPYYNPNPYTIERLTTDQILNIQNLIINTQNHLFGIYKNFVDLNHQHEFVEAIRKKLNDAMQEIEFKNFLMETLGYYFESFENDTTMNQVLHEGLNFYEYFINRNAIRHIYRVANRVIPFTSQYISTKNLDIAHRNIDRIVDSHITEVAIINKFTLTRENLNNLENLVLEIY